MWAHLKSLGKYIYVYFPSLPVLKMDTAYMNENKSAFPKS